MAQTRRSILAKLVVAGAAPLAGCVPRYTEAQLSPGLTAPQVLGPYHPSGTTLATCFQPHLDNDLATVAGQNPAEGLRMYLLGTLRDEVGPVADAQVEIWQTCHRGRYAHPDDGYGLEVPRDEGFQYFGTCRTNDAGEYLFRTVMPRRYPAGYPGDKAWWRQPHVHFRVTGADPLAPADEAHRWLTTQLYFDDPLDVDNAWNHIAVQGHDKLWNGLPQERIDDRELICLLGAASGDADLARLRPGLLPGGSTQGDDGPWGVARAGRFDLRIERGEARVDPVNEVPPPVPAPKQMDCGALLERLEARPVDERVPNGGWKPPPPR